MLSAYRFDKKRNRRLNIYCARCAKSITATQPGNRTRKCADFLCIPDAFDQRVIDVIKEQNNGDVVTVQLHSKCEKELAAKLDVLRGAKESARTRAQAVALADVPEPQRRTVPGAVAKVERLVEEAEAVGATGESPWGCGCSMHVRVPARPLSCADQCTRVPTPQVLSNAGHRARCSATSPTLEPPALPSSLEHLMPTCSRSLQAQVCMALLVAS